MCGKGYPPTPMAEARTEQPTARREAEARAEGQVAVSHELTAALALIAGVGAAAWLGERLVSACRSAVVAALAQAGEPRAGLSALLPALTAIALALLPLLACVAAVAALSGLLQVGP